MHPTPPLGPVALRATAASLWITTTTTRWGDTAASAHRFQPVASAFRAERRSSFCSLLRQGDFKDPKARRKLLTQLLVRNARKTIQNR